MSYSVLETEWWSLAVPPEWWAEHEEDTILVGDHDGVGCLEFSTLFKDSGEFDAAAVLELAREESGAAMDWRELRIGDFSGVTGQCREEGAAIREWYVYSGAMLIYITYSCEEENSGMDDAAIDEILDTLSIAGD